MTRRQFVAAASAATPLLRAKGRLAARAANIRGANDRLRVGVIGCGGMAGGHMNALLGYLTAHCCQGNDCGLATPASAPGCTTC